MSYQLFLTNCGCLSSFDAEQVNPHAINVIDGDKLPEYGLYIVGLTLQLSNGKKVFLKIDSLFADRLSFLSYLSSNFATIEQIYGHFYYEGGQLKYSNPEKFLSAEIMAILGTRLLVYKFGAGGQSPIIPYRRELENGTIVPSDPALANILQIRWGDQLINENISLTTDRVTQDPINYGLTFTDTYEDGNMWILVSDVVPETSLPTFDYLVPIQLS